MDINSEEIHQTVTTDLCISQYVNDTSKHNESLLRSKVPPVLTPRTSKPEWGAWGSGTGSGVGAKENGLVEYRAAFSTPDPSR